MVEKVIQHRHCRNCDKAVPYKDEFCDEKCESAWKAKMQTKKRQLMFLYLAAVMIMVLALILGVIGR